jgi:hypothetical protein
MPRRCCAGVSVWLHSGMTSSIPRVCDIGLAGLDLDLIYLPFSCKRQQSAPGDVCVSPVGKTQLDIVLRLQA